MTPALAALFVLIASTEDWERAYRLQALAEQAAESGVVSEPDRLFDEAQDASPERDRAAGTSLSPIPPTKQISLLPQRLFDRFAVRLLSDYRRGSVVPSRPLGPPYSSTFKMNITRGSWSAGLVLDRDRYEHRLDDLNRFWLEQRTERLRLIIGDFTVRSGEGVTLWTKPAYYTPGGVAVAKSADGFDLQPAGNRTANSASRGVALRSETERFELFGAVAITSLDAILAPDGSALRLSDGGLHRTEGESVKRNSVGERLVAGGVASRIERNGVSGRLAIIGWKSGFDRSFTEEPGETDPYPMRGRSFGAAGVAGEVTGDRFQVGVETGWDARGNPAARGRFGARLARDVDLDVAAFRFPVAYTNPHAVPVNGRRPKGLYGVGTVVAVKTDPSADLTIAAGYDARMRQTATTDTPPTYAFAELDYRKRFPNGEWNLRLNQRESGEASDRSRVSRIRSGAAAALSSNSTGRFWCEIARLEGCPSPGVAAAGSLMRQSEQFKLHWIAKTGLELFATPKKLPIYSADVSPPDIFSSVRLAGTGGRVWGEVGVEGTAGLSLRLRASQTEYGSRSEIGKTAVYLLFGKVWLGAD